MTDLPTSNPPSHEPSCENKADEELIKQRSLYLKWVEMHPPRSHSVSDVMCNEAEFSIETGSTLFELMYDQAPLEALAEMAKFEANVDELQGKLELVFEIGDGSSLS